MQPSASMIRVSQVIAAEGEHKSSRALRHAAEVGEIQFCQLARQKNLIVFRSSWTVRRRCSCATSRP